MVECGIEKMMCKDKLEVLNNLEAMELFEHIEKWVAQHSIREQANKRYYKYYFNKAWKKVYDKYDELVVKKELTSREMLFLQKVFYTGEIKRIHKYFPRRKRHICEMKDMCVSWSKRIEGLENLNINFNKGLLIITKPVLSIDVFGLLEFILINNPIIPKNKINQLLMYLEESEVVYYLDLEQVKDVQIIDVNMMTKKITCIGELNKDKWKRNKFK